jgi:hypothetical protein
MIRFKDTVDFRGMTPQIAFAIERADEVNITVWQEYYRDKVIPDEVANGPGVYLLVAHNAVLGLPTSSRAIILDVDTWITSISDDSPNRVPGSKHRTGEAVDFSVQDHPDPKAWADDLRKRLGPQFDVVLHDTGSGLHIHVEFDPKGKPLAT